MRFEGYEVRGELARGGMGVVYRAHDPALGRDVAIKVVLGEETSPTQIQRFLREGEITARLDHPGILRVHGSGERNGRPYLVYELVEGARTLEDALPQVPLRRRLELLRDTALALGFAHAQGVVHRDVKPENVLIDPAGRVRVADFGLASAEGLSRLTRTGATMGTPHYMAPEQLAADRDAIGPASDVWSLGVMLYQALTGQLPFEGENLLTLGARAAAGLARPPSSASSDVPPALDAICLQALATAPERRYPHAGAFAADLDAYLRGEPPQALLSRRAGRRGRSALAWLALVLVLAGGALLPRGPAEPPAPSPEPTVGSVAATPSSVAPASPAADDDAADDDAVERRRRVLRSRETPLLRQRVLKPGQATRVRFLDRGRFFCWSAGEGGVQLWELRDGALEPSAAWGQAEGLDGCADLVPEPSGTYLLASPDQIWRLDPQRPELEPLYRVARGVRCLAVSPDGEQVAIGIGDRVQLRDRGGRRLRTSPAGESLVQTVAFSTDGRELAWVMGAPVGQGGMNTNTFNRWDLATAGRPLTSRLPRYSKVVAALPTEPAYLVGTGSALLRFATGQLDPVGRLQGDVTSQDTLQAAFEGAAAHGLGLVAALWLRPDASRMFSLASAKTFPRPLTELRCWDLPSGDEVGRVLVWDEHCEDLAVSPDEELLVVGTRDGEVVVWWTPALTEAP